MHRSPLFSALLTGWLASSQKLFLSLCHCSSRFAGVTFIWTMKARRLVYWLQSFVRTIISAQQSHWSFFLLISSPSSRFACMNVRWKEMCSLTSPSFWDMFQLQFESKNCTEHFPKPKTQKLFVCKSIDNRTMPNDNCRPFSTEIYHQHYQFHGARNRANQVLS